MQIKSLLAFVLLAITSANLSRAAPTLTPAAARSIALTPSDVIDLESRSNKSKADYESKKKHVSKKEALKKKKQALKKKKQAAKKAAKKAAQKAAKEAVQKAAAEKSKWWKPVEAPKHSQDKHKSVKPIAVPSKPSRPAYPSPKQHGPVVIVPSSQESKPQSKPPVVVDPPRQQLPKEAAKPRPHYNPWKGWKGNDWSSWKNKYSPRPKGPSTTPQVPTTQQPAPQEPNTPAGTEEPCILICPPTSQQPASPQGSPQLPTVQLPGEGGQQTPPSSNGDQQAPSNNEQAAPSNNGGQQAPSNNEQAAPSNNGGQQAPSNNGGQQAPSNNEQAAPSNNGGQQAPSNNEEQGHGSPQGSPRLPQVQLPDHEQGCTLCFR